MEKLNIEISSPGIKSWPNPKMNFPEDYYIRTIDVLVEKHKLWPKDAFQRISSTIMFITIMETWNKYLKK